MLDKKSFTQSESFVIESFQFLNVLLHPSYHNRTLGADNRNPSTCFQVLNQIQLLVVGIQPMAQHHP